MKDYYFLAGLPRSGNTVLSSILNQNPLIYSSPLSPISEILYQYETTIPETENVKRLNDKTRLDNVANSIVSNEVALFFYFVSHP